MKAEHIGAGIATVGTTVVLYFLLAGEVSGGEAIGAAIVLAIAGPYAFAVARTGTVPMRVSWRGWGALVRAFGAVLPDLWRVGGAVLFAVRRRPAGMTGAVKSVPFRFGALDAGDIGRRAAVGISMSLAPNGFVIGMDRERDELILHQLVDRAVGGTGEWPS